MSGPPVPFRRHDTTVSWRALQDNAGFSGGGPGVGSTWKPGVKTGASADKWLTVGGGGGGVGVGQCGC